MKISIDTNIYTEFCRGNDNVRSIISSAERVSISAIVIGELIYGFRNGTRFVQNKRLLDSFLAEPLVSFLPVTMATCECFGTIAAELRQAGTPIPQNDIWIAAHAMESGTSLLSFDSHFKAVPRLMFTLLQQ